jgi:hypothetical protein
MASAKAGSAASSYALHSLYMGGASRWSVLTDQGLTEKISTQIMRHLMPPLRMLVFDRFGRRL